MQDEKSESDVGKKRKRRRQRPRLERVNSFIQDCIPLTLGVRNKTIAVADNGQVAREDILSTDRHEKA